MYMFHVCVYVCVCLREFGCVLICVWRIRARVYVRSFSSVCGGRGVGYGGCTQCMCARVFVGVCMCMFGCLCVRLYYARSPVCGAGFVCM